MDKLKLFLTDIRNGIAFAFSWLVICSCAASLIMRNATLSISFLMKLLALTFWGVLCFVLCFRTDRVRRKGFIFALTVFYILFIPVEILMFFRMGLFTAGGSIALWAAFAGIVTGMYLISVLIDIFVMRKRGDEYTALLQKYQDSKNM